MEMKFNDLDTRSAALGGMAGLGLGGLVGWLAASHVHRRRLQAELVSLKDHYDTRLARLSAKVARFERAERLRLEEEARIRARAEELIAEQGYKDPGDESDPDAEHLPDDDPYGDDYGLSAVGQPGSAGLDGSSDDEPGQPGPAAPEAAEDAGLPESDVRAGSLAQPDKSKPYEITFEAMGEMIEEGWDTMTITYYIGDGVLVDDKDQPIRNILMTTGPLSRESFGVLSGDDRLLYIRNHKLEHDFEVVLHDGKWTEMVGLSDSHGNQAE